MLPRVILFNGVSVDGRMDGFTGDIGLYYELATRWNADAMLSGSNTMLAAGALEADEPDLPLDPALPDPTDQRPWLVVADSRGRCRHWNWLRQQPYWRGGIALCSRATPQVHRDYLAANRVDSIVAGDTQVDLRTALQELNARYGIQCVRVDSGGLLNGALLRAGLVDEVSVLISPSLAGGTTANSIFVAQDLTASEAKIPLRLCSVEQIGENAVWLRYEVIR